MSTPLHQAAQKALAALEVCTGRTTGAGVMRVRAIAEVREALAHVDQTNTSPERVQKTPGNVHVAAQMALDALMLATTPIAKDRQEVLLAIGTLRAALAAPQGEPVAYLYTLEYGATMADTRLSEHQLNYPFGVVGSDYLLKNDDGVSYVRQTPLYAAPQPAAPVQPDRPIKSPTKFMDRPEQPVKSCATCKYHNRASYQVCSPCMHMRVDNWEPK